MFNSSRRHECKNGVKRRTGGGEEKGETRNSVDETVNAEGRILLNELIKRGWAIMNGYKGEGGWTYVGETGTSMIDYVIANVEAEGEIKKVEIGTETESDHLPLDVTLEGQSSIEEKKEDKVRKRKINDWTEEGIEYYHRECEGWSNKEIETEIKWETLREKIKNARKSKIKSVKKWKIGKRIWHCTKWKKKREELAKTLKKWKKGKGTREEYVEKRKNKENKNRGRGMEVYK
ncbi:hypothetical protein WH47_06626 [Habropoda laboriosa]|uniref:Endonuclease/exonuclease/phosphatase domain-containing protein n=1 Tax=Habropoda laboriosa TaxID=597456 RepID=A0A0L7QJB1_9HYME|nr:hypothetical protein WH47_06626 [Habropoda laboriosa]